MRIQAPLTFPALELSVEHLCLLKEDGHFCAGGGVGFVIESTFLFLFLLVRLVLFDNISMEGSASYNCLGDEPRTIKRPMNCFMVCLMLCNVYVM